MIKVLIVSNGINFRIKKKTLFGWKFITCYKKVGIFESSELHSKEFDTFKLAFNYIKEEYGKKFKLMNSKIWVPTVITKELISESI